MSFSLVSLNERTAKPKVSPKLATSTALAVTCAAMSPSLPVSQSHVAMELLAGLRQRGLAAHQQGVDHAALLG
jgi:hypothetical protein